MENLEFLREEVNKTYPNKNLLKAAFNSFKLIIGSIAAIPDFTEGINKLGTLLGIIK